MMTTRRCRPDDCAEWRRTPATRAPPLPTQSPHCLLFVYEYFVCFPWQVRHFQLEVVSDDCEPIYHGQPRCQQVADASRARARTQHALVQMRDRLWGRVLANVALSVRVWQVLAAMGSLGFVPLTPIECTPLRARRLSEELETLRRVVTSDEALSGTGFWQGPLMPDWLFRTLCDRGPERASPPRGH